MAEFLYPVPNLIGKLLTLKMQIPLVTDRPLHVGRYVRLFPGQNIFVFDCTDAGLLGRKENIWKIHALVVDKQSGQTILGHILVPRVIETKEFKEIYGIEKILQRLFGDDFELPQDTMDLTSGCRQEE